VHAAVLALLASLAAPAFAPVGPSAWAGPFEDGLEAYGRGEHAAALELWLPLATQGHAQAQFRVGLLYDFGQGVEQDRAEAVEWYRLAADQGLAPAQFNLAMMFYRGRGTPQDLVQAYVWFSLAAARYPQADRDGRANAIRRRDNLAKYDLTPQQLADARKLIREWKPRGP